MKRIILTTLAALALLAGFGAAPALAQTYPNGQDVSVSVVVATASVFTLNTTSITLTGIPGQQESAQVNYNVESNNPTGYLLELCSVTPPSAVISAIDVKTNSGYNGGDFGPPVACSSGSQGFLVVTSAPDPANGTNYTDTYSLTIPNAEDGTYTDTAQYSIVPNS